MQVLNMEISYLGVAFGAVLGLGLEIVELNHVSTVLGWIGSFPQHLGGRGWKLLQARGWAWTFSPRSAVEPIFLGLGSWVWGFPQLLKNWKVDWNFSSFRGWVWRAERKFLNAQYLGPRFDVSLENSPEACCFFLTRCLGSVLGKCRFQIRKDMSGQGQKQAFKSRAFFSSICQVGASSF